jgi:putative RNA 2'-phosphotransferase
MMPVNLHKLSKIISHALRHEPWLYELELDEDGWVPVSQLLESLRSDGEVWQDLSASDIERMILSSTKRRHEIADGRIRAIYGHSIPVKLRRLPHQPPSILFHGTHPSSVQAIKKCGLKPMNRQNVHLSADKETALGVGRRKSPDPVLLCIRSFEAFQNGVAFYKGSEKVWLADDVPPKYIELGPLSLDVAAGTENRLT